MPMFRRALNVLAAAGLIGTIAGAPPVWAQGFSGGLSGMSGMSVQGSGVSVTPNIYTPSYYQPPQRFRDLTVTGRVGTDKSSAVKIGKVVRLSLDGKDIPMQLDTEVPTEDVEFDPNATYAQDLYRAMLTKRVEVVGRESLRNQIEDAARTGEPVRIYGYVFNPTSPYLVVKSVKEPR